MTGREGRPRVSLHIQESDRILQSQTQLASPSKGISGRTDWESTENMTLPKKEPFLTLFLPSSRFLLRHSAEVDTESWKHVFNAYSQYSPFLSSNHTYRETLTMGNRQSSVVTVSGGTQERQFPHRDQHRSFPTLSFGSQSPPGEASCTQQQGAPQLTQQSPSDHRAGPGPSQLRTEWPPHPWGWSQSQKWRLRALVLNAGSRSDLLHCEHTWD